MQANQYYDPNGSVQLTQPMQQTTVPNVMMDETQNMEGVQLQQGGYLMPTPMPRDVDPSSNLPAFAEQIQVPPMPQFDIPDPIMRRNFVTKVLTILLLQNIIVLPVIELFLLIADGPIVLLTFGGIWLLAICIFTLMYIFSDARRNPPMNFVGLIVVTLFWTVQEGVYATNIGSHLAIMSQMVIIAQLIALIVYTKQDRFRFNNINSILLIVFIFIICVGVVAIVSPTSLHALNLGSAINVIYFVYDIQLMLSGHHGYNLQPEEHIFAAANVYVDLPNFIWRVFRAILRCLYKHCCKGGSDSDPGCDGDGWCSDDD